MPLFDALSYETEGGRATVAKKLGRRKRSRNKGYFFRTGRGWFTKDGAKFVPLTDQNGDRLRDPNLDEEVVKNAVARWRSGRRLVPADDAPVGLICAKYLENLRAEAGEIGVNPAGVAKTYIDRGQTLYDFCFGLPAEFFCGGDIKKREERIKEGRPPQIHVGYGDRRASTITPADIDDWLNAHVWKAGGRRTRVQAIKRAFNFAVERKVIQQSPIKGYRIPRSQSRVTYLTPNQEQALIDHASYAFAVALKVCIRTGSRPGCEFAALTKQHVRDSGDRMEWVFKPEESKTGKLRRILITDQEIIEIVRANMRDDGQLFRNRSGSPWSRQMLSQNFRRVKSRLEAGGETLDPDSCMYSCRHTYAKRTLEGYWSGKPASINTLARLMGNSVQVCIEHYLQFSEADNEMLWSVA